MRASVTNRSAIMPVTQADIDQLNAAIANDTRQVTLNGQSITYRSIDDLIKARNDMRNELANQDAAATGKPVQRRAYAYYSGRGYN